MKTIKHQDIGDVGTIIISDNLKKKIDFLHENVGATEWSGILLYKTLVKSIKGMKDLLFRAEDVFPMDIGSGSYTSYKYDGSVVDMYENIPGAMNMNMGHIHSHHNMKAFFSQTDIDEIVDNAEHYNYYISLVVAFDGKYVCKIAIPVKESVDCEYTFKDRNGKNQHFRVQEERDSVIVGNLIVKMENRYSPAQWFTDRLIDIKRKAVIVSKEKSVAKVTQEKATVPAKTSSYSYNVLDDLFIVNILSPTDITKEEFKQNKYTVYEFMKELGELDESDFQYVCNMLEDNISIIHYNVFGQNEVFNEPVHIKKAINTMKIYKYLSALTGKRIERICAILEKSITIQTNS